MHINILLRNIVLEADNIFENELKMSIIID